MFDTWSAWYDLIVGHEESKQLSTSACKQWANENDNSVQSDQDFATFLMQFLLKALRICQVHIGFIIVLLFTPTTVAGLKRLAASVCDSVCVSVCLAVHTITHKRMNPKCSNLVRGNDLGISYKWYDFGVERSRSHRHFAKPYWRQSSGCCEFCTVLSAHPLVFIYNCQLLTVIWHLTVGSIDVDLFIYVHWWAY